MWRRKRFSATSHECPDVSGGAVSESSFHTYRLSGLRWRRWPPVTMSGWPRMDVGGKTLVLGRVRLRIAEVLEGIVFIACQIGDTNAIIPLLLIFAYVFFSHSTRAQTQLISSAFMIDACLTHN